MDDNKKTIWIYHHLKKGLLDNDYYFYEDGTIVHHYDRTTEKVNIEDIVSASDIPESDKDKILSQCKNECNEEVYHIIESLIR